MRVESLLVEAMRLFGRRARSGGPGESALGPAAASGTAACLLLIEAQPDLTAGELARQMGLSDSAVTGLLNRLEEAGLVERQRRPADRRHVHLTPTPRGREAADRCRRQRAQDLRPWFDALSGDELRTLATILAKVTRRAREG